MNQTLKQALKVKVTCRKTGLLAIIVCGLLLLFSCHSDSDEKKELIEISSPQDSLLYSQKPAILNIADEGYLDSAKAKLKKFNKDSLQTSEAKALFHYTRAYLLDYDGNYRQSIEEYKKALYLLNKAGEFKSLLLANTHNDLGYVYNEIYFEAQALESYERSFNIVWTYHKDNADEVASATNNYLGALADYGSTEKINQVLDLVTPYFDDLTSSTDLQDYTEEQQLKLLSIYYLSISKATRLSFNENLLRNVIHQQEELFQKAPKELQNKYINRLIYTYDQAGYAYLKVKKNQEAFGAFEKMRSRSRSKTDITKAESNFAALFLQTRQYQKAEKAYSRIINSQKWEKGDVNLLVLKTAEAWMKSKQNKVSEAREAIVAMWNMYFGRNVSVSQLTLTDLDNRNGTRYMFALNTSAEIFRKHYLHTKDKSSLQIAGNLALLGARMFQNYYKKEEYNEELTSINEKNREELLSALLLNENKNQMDALQLLENNASQHLWKNFLIKNARGLRIDPKLLKQQNELRLLVIENPENDALRKKLNEVNEQIEKQTPGYIYQAVDLKKVQASLIPKEAILKYLYAEESVFALLIKKDQIKINRIGFHKQIDSLSQKYYQALANLEPNATTIADIISNKLLEPVNLSTIERLTIIPEKGLLNLPFETLGKTQEIPIKYAFSLHFEDQNIRSDLQWGIPKLAAFSPEYKDKTKLKNTIEEVEEVTRIFDGTRYYGSQASKKNFLNQLTSYPIQHLAMHAEIDTSDYEQSALLFGDSDKLKFNEIYALTIPSELVTLSACNTGIGLYHAGEGLMSLSRALTYAGTKAVIQSLWSIPDKETAEIMQYFYENLKEGKDKDVALYEAKQSFLKSNPLKQHPYFWAGFVLVGNNEPLIKKNGWKYVAFILIIGSGIYLVFKFSSNSSASSRQGF